MLCVGIAPAPLLSEVAATAVMATSTVDACVRAATAAARAAAWGGMGNAAIGRCTYGAAVAGQAAETVPGI